MRGIDLNDKCQTPCSLLFLVYSDLSLELLDLLLVLLDVGHELRILCLNTGELLLHLLQLVFKLHDPGIVTASPVDTAEVGDVCATPIVISLQTVNVSLQALYPELHPLDVPLEVVVLPQYP